MGKVRLVDTGKGSFFGDYLYEQVLDQDDFGGIAATVRLGAVHGAAAVGLSRPGAQELTATRPRCAPGTIGREAGDGIRQLTMNIVRPRDARVREKRPSEPFRGTTRPPF